MLARFEAPDLIALTDRGNEPTGAIVVAVLDQAISDVTEIINAALAARYAVPLNPVPPVIEAVAADLVWERLHRNGSDEAKARGDAARRLLNNLATGVAQLPGLVAGSATSSGGAVLVADRSRLFDGGGW